MPTSISDDSDHQRTRCRLGLRRAQHAVQQASFATGVVVIGTVFGALGSASSTEAFVYALRDPLSANIGPLRVAFTLILKIPRFPARDGVG
jgi:hypothetical protein